MSEQWETMVYQGVVFSGKIEVSNFGRIRNRETGTIYKLYKNKKGYFQVCVSNGRAKRKVIRVHKAVAETFVSGKKEGYVVNHIDGNKQNNAYWNLEWCTLSQNTLHAYRTGLMPSDLNRGEKSGITTLKKEDVERIRTVYTPKDRKYGTRALAREYGVDHMTISRIVRRKTWA